MKKTGRLYIISGPSGVGKGTICNLLHSRCKSLVKSVSVTTRKPRLGEIEGVNYFFKTLNEYQKIKNSNGFLETFEIYGNFYGTPIEYVNNNLKKGKSVLLEIDVQGALAVKQKMPDAKLIFVEPPSIEHLKSRLTNRNSENEQSFKKRIDAAQAEMKNKDKYDYVVINDTVEKAVNDIMQIIERDTLC